MTNQPKNEELSGSEILIHELDLACKDIALEVAKIRDEGSILSKDSFDKIMTLIEKSAKIKSLIPDKKEPEKAVAAGEKKIKNIQDFVLNGKE